MFPFVNVAFWNTHCIIYIFGKTLDLENWRLEIRKVTWIEKWEQFSEINFCKLLFSKVLRDILLQKKAKIAKFMKVSLAKVSLIKVYLFWASHSKYLLLFIVIIIIYCYCQYCYQRMAFSAYYKYKISVDMMYDKATLIKCRKDISVFFSE